MSICKRELTVIGQVVCVKVFFSLPFVDLFSIFFSYRQLAEELLTKEVLNYDDIATILGPCPFGDKRVRFHSQEAAFQSPLFSG